MTRRQILSWTFFWVYTVNLLLSSILHPDQLPSFLDMLDDKLLHFFQHFLLFFFALAAFKVSNREILSRHAVLMSFFYCLLIGALIELEQLLVPYRHTEFLDWIADLVGTSVAWLSWRFLPFVNRLFIQEVDD